MISILRYCSRRCQTIPTAAIFRRPYMKTSEKMEFLLKKTDQMPRHFKLIYRYPSSKMAGFMWHTVHFTSFVTIGIFIYVWFVEKPANTPMEDDEILLKHKVFLDDPLQGSVLFLFTVFTLTISSIMRRRSPMRVYFNPDGNVYKAVFIGRIPFLSEFYEFKKGAISYVAQNSILPWRSSLFQANRRKMILYDDYFKTGGDLATMLDQKNLHIKDVR